MTFITKVTITHFLIKVTMTYFLMRHITTPSNEISVTCVLPHANRVFLHRAIPSYRRPPPPPCSSLTKRTACWKQVTSSSSALSSSASALPKWRSDRSCGDRPSCSRLRWPSCMPPRSGSRRRRRRKRSWRRRTKLVRSPYIPSPSFPRLSCRKQQQLPRFKNLLPS